MSFRGLLEILVHVESFRNIDLKKQGLYTLSVSLQHEYKDNTYPATPVHIHHPFDKEKRPNPKTHNILEAHCNEERNCFTTKTFYVRYCEEVVSIDEIFQFRTELELSNSPLQLCIQLLWADTKGRILEQMDPSFEFIIVQEKIVRIHNPFDSNANVCVVNFEDLHFSAVTVGVYSALLDLRWRSKGMMTPCEEQERNLSLRCSNTEENWEQQMVDQLFFNDVKIAEAQIMRHVDILSSSYEALRKNYILFSNKFLPSDLKEQLSVDIQGENTPEDTSDLNELVDMARSLTDNLKDVAMRILIIWNRMLIILLQSSNKISSYLEEDYWKKHTEIVCRSVLQTVRHSKEFNFTNNVYQSKAHKLTAEARRASNEYNVNHYSDLQFMDQFGPLHAHPIFFEEINYRKNTEERQSPHGAHLFVICHGFGGNDVDMHTFRNHILLRHPNALVLCSEDNEFHTAGNIHEMGIRLANEVQTYIQDYCPGNTLARLSFAGHSLGGLIIRAAIPFLEKYSHKLDTFLSLAAPHLGYMYSSSKLVNAGLLFLKKWQKSHCIKQLTMSDNEDLRQTFMYQLACNNSLELFKKIIFWGSGQDTYAPYDSARVNISPKTSNDVKGCVYTEMVQNMIGGITAKSITRVDVNFFIEENNLDSYIGRTAHIKFISNKDTLRMIVERYLNNQRIFVKMQSPVLGLRWTICDAETAVFYWSCTTPAPMLCDGWVSSHIRSDTSITHALTAISVNESFDDIVKSMNSFRTSNIDRGIRTWCDEISVQAREFVTEKWAEIDMIVSDTQEFANRGKEDLFKQLGKLDEQLTQLQKEMENPSENSELEYMLTNLGNVNFANEIKRYISLQKEDDMYFSELKAALANLTKLDSIAWLNVHLPSFANNRLMLFGQNSKKISFMDINDNVADILSVPFVELNTNCDLNWVALDWDTVFYCGLMRKEVSQIILASYEYNAILDTSTDHNQEKTVAACDNPIAFEISMKSKEIRGKRSIPPPTGFALVLGEGQIFMLGGRDDNDDPVTEIQAYAIEDDQWRDLEVCTPFGFRQTTACKIESLIYTTSYELTTVMTFDTFSHQFSTLSTTVPLGIKNLLPVNNQLHMLWEAPVETEEFIYTTAVMDCSRLGDFVTVSNKFYFTEGGLQSIYEYDPEEKVVIRHYQRISSACLTPIMPATDTAGTLTTRTDFSLFF